MLVYLPKSDDPVPVILALNFKGNQTVCYDSAVLPSAATAMTAEELEAARAERSGKWDIETALSRGCAVATIYCGDFALDNKETYRDGVLSLFDEPDCGAISAWAFGIERGVDCLLTMSEIDGSRIADMGHSRLGKAALWAGANDERISLVISNDSGNSGASLSRSNAGETVQSINTLFPYWFSPAYAAFGGKNVNALPVDQNLLLACIAPRHLYVACAQSDLWADPLGALNALQLSRGAFALYGLEVLPDMAQQPSIDTPVWSESMGYHIRAGWHDVLPEDWSFYLDYMEKYL